LTLGAVLMGVLISTVLYGAVSIQVYAYVTDATSKSDPLWLRIHVWTVWFLETFHTAFVWAYIYELAVINFNNPAGLTQAGWSLAFSVLTHGALSFLVQWFFSYRVYVMSGNIWVAIPGATLSALRFVVEIYICTVTINTPSVTIFSGKDRWLTLLAISSSLVADVVLSTSLIFFMTRSRSPFETTSMALDRIIRWTIETGLVTTFMAALILILVTAQASNVLWLGVLIIYAKIYSNALMVSLNGRRSLRQDIASKTAGMGRTTDHQGTHAVVSIHVAQTTNRHEDFELGDMHSPSFQDSSSHGKEHEHKINSYV